MGMGGYVVIDPTKYVVLPADHGAWTDEIVEAAYLEMSKMTVGDFHDVIATVFTTFSTTPEALSDYCRLKGYALPQFWFEKNDDGLKWNNRREREAEAWSQKLIKRPKEKSPRVI
jgi:hypothetical protein